ncbi:hypothetical protein E2C01_100523 [Portunus trituberculatus]|uniref:Uncharacterized protein n=1 Tax=Portunus trituberculatus TaxID=210409 RepID=A0A5B7K893_PORTR|nr:hypothetical protein [Portunus trituberculatus]
MDSPAVEALSEAGVEEIDAVEATSRRSKFPCSLDFHTPASPTPTPSPSRHTHTSPPIPLLSPARSLRGDERVGSFVDHGSHCSLA